MALLLLLGLVIFAGISDAKDSVDENRRVRAYLINEANKITGRSMQEAVREDSIFWYGIRPDTRISSKEEYQEWLIGSQNLKTLLKYRKF